MSWNPRLLRFARKELYRGPYGFPLLARLGFPPVGRLTILRGENIRLWRRLARLRGLGLNARKRVFRILYVLPLGTGDAAAPWRVAKRHRALLGDLRAGLGRA